jgi:UPF0716 family protein affecting phage T7 exclusion
MTLLIQKLSRPFFAGALCAVTLVLFVAVFGAGATLVQAKGSKTAPRMVKKLTRDLGGRFPAPI